VSRPDSADSRYNDFTTFLSAPGLISIGSTLTIRFTVSPNIPLPARNLLSVVMAALKTKKSAAEELIRTGHVQLKGIPLTRIQTVLEVGDTIEIDPLKFCFMTRIWSWSTNPPVC
jgi:hypothetical protein